MSTNVVIGRKRADLTITFNGKEINLENVLLSTAKMKAHHMVRKYLMSKFQKKEATAKIMLKDNCVSEIYGFRKCGLGAINIIHSDSPGMTHCNYRRL
jgi:hypothetical protein